jgi:hypothetical protein
LVNRLALALLLVTSTVYAGPSVRCDAVQQGKRTLATVQVAQFFDKELLRLIRLGLEGRLKLTLVLVKRRSMWFDDDVMRLNRTSVVSWDKKKRTYLLDGVPLAATALDALLLDRIALGRRDTNTAGSHYVEVDAELQVVTVSSMMAAAKWVTGGGDDGDVITTQLAKVVVADLARSASTSCDVR